jgi:two-component system response regulator YesN
MEGSDRAGSRIFKRLLVYNLIAVLVVSLVPQFVFYRIFMGMYNKEIQGLNMQTVRQFQNAVDEPVLKEMVDFPNLHLSELESNEALVYPLTHDISRNSSAILKVAGRIDDIKNNTQYLHSIDLYYPRGNLLFLGDRVCMLNESECELGARSEWFKSFTETDINIDWLEAREAGAHDPSRIASYVRSIPFFGSKELRQGVVAVNLDLAELDIMLQELKPFAEGALLIVDASGSVIAHNYGSELPPDYLTDEVRSKLTNVSEEGMFDAKVAGQASVVSFIPSRYNDWRYVSITSMESAYRKSTQIRSWMLAIGAAFLGANVIVTVWLTNRAHRPISNKMEDLRQSLARHMPIVRHNYILGLLFGSAQDSQKTGDMASMLGFGHDQRRIASFALRVSRPEGMEHHEALAADFHLIERLEAGFANVTIAAIRDERSQIFGFISFDERNNRSDMIAGLVALIEETAGEKHSLCLGGFYPSSDETIARSFAEADETLEYAFVYPSNKVMFYGDIHTGQRIEPSGMPKQLDDIPAAIRAGDEKRMRGLIAELLGEIRQGSWTIRYCRNVMLDMVLLIEKTAQQLSYQPSELFGGESREQYRKLEHVDQFEEWISSVALSVINRINERKGQIDQDFAKKIVLYVNNSISHQLSLVSVAEHVGVSPTYLSKIFKHITGSNFNEYVTGLRLERAEELLREKKLSVQEISYRVGYQSTHHFIRLFKEKHGLTPKLYQKTYADEGTDQGEA